MKPIRDSRSGRLGFTIIELLTVMSIIVILMSLLAPALNRVRRYATDVKQRAQFHSIGIGLDTFNADFDGYPDSNAVDDQGYNYCGAMRLAEAMVGQDLKGFNPSSRFEQNGFVGSGSVGGTPKTPTDGMPYPPYNTCGVTVNSACYAENLRLRKMYLELEHANAYLLKDIYDTGTITSATTALSGKPSTVTDGFDPCTFVLCDSYNRVTNRTNGKRIGMPILYYKADQSKLKFPPSGTPPTTMRGGIMGSPDGAYFYTYNCWDNQALIDMGMPWQSSLVVHRLAEQGVTPEGFSITGGNAYPEEFYRIIRDPKVPSGDRPYRADSYILISAGFDGEYGTSDDIYNFGD